MIIDPEYDTLIRKFFWSIIGTSEFSVKTHVAYENLHFYVSENACYFYRNIDNNFLFYNEKLETLLYKCFNLNSIESHSLIKDEIQKKLKLQMKHLSNISNTSFEYVNEELLKEAIIIYSNKN